MTHSLRPALNLLRRAQGWHVPQEPLLRLSCQNSQRNAIARKLPFLLCLGSQSEQAGDEGDLPADVSLVHPVHLSFPEGLYPFG
jgi:hypothetical protein